jgi:carbonic anhydrase
VHADEHGHLAVIALMFEEGASHPVIEALWKNMPEHEGDTHALNIEVDPLTLLPESKDYYRFNGSLTTPPCSEGVWWFVMKQPVMVSADQVQAFADVLHEPNNRPVQPVNARPVLQ